MLIFRLSTLLCVSIFPASSVLAQVSIVQAPTNFEFVDMGYDVDADEVAIVGHVINPDDSSDRTATLFELNANQDGFTTQTLANLPGATSNAEVNGISSDGVRIAGTSSSSNAIDIEGATWLRSSPNIAIGTGFISSFPNRSSSLGAWKDGVVGESGGQIRPTTWTAQNGIQELSGTSNGIAIALEASVDGNVIVGFSSHEVFDGAAYYWENNVINRLDDTVLGFTTINSVARNVSPNGNYIGGEILLQDPQDNVLSVPVVWEGSTRTLRVLRDPDGSLVQGNVLDISDLGYATGTFANVSLTDSFGFIWNPSFGDNVEIFEDWLTIRQFDYSPQIRTFATNSISEDRVNGTLRFTSLTDNGFSFVEVAIVDMVLGDVNQDSAVDFLDISPFIGVLAAGEFQFEADVDQNGVVNFLDIPAFIAILAGQ